MDASSYIKAEMQKHLDEAKATVEGAEGAGRSMTDTERKSVEKNTTRVGELQVQLADVTSASELKDSIDKLGKSLIAPPRHNAADGQEAPASSVGDAFVKSAEYKALTKRGFDGDWTTGPVVLDYAGLKANESVMSTQQMAVSMLPGFTEIRKQPNTVMGVLPAGTVDGNLIKYIKETTATNSANDVAEISTYDQSVLIHQTASVEVEKIGSLLYVSEELLSDVSAIRSTLDGRLAAFNEYAEEDGVVNGNGASPQLDGLYTQVTQAQALGADTVMDAVYKAKTQVRTGSFLEPTHILIHPTDWQNLRLSKDATDNYFNGLGPFSGGDVEPPVWGLKPLITSRTSQGTALVGAFANPMAVQLFRKGGLTVEATNSHASLFATGQVTIRATSRLALVIYRIAAFCEVTGLPA